MYRYKIEIDGIIEEHDLWSEYPYSEEMIIEHIKSRFKGYAKYVSNSLYWVEEKERNELNDAIENSIKFQW